MKNNLIKKVFSIFLTGIFLIQPFSVLADTLCWDECAYVGEIIEGSGGHYVCGLYDGDECFDKGPFIEDQITCWDECAYVGEIIEGSGGHYVCGLYDGDECFDKGPFIEDQPTCWDECSYEGKHECSGTSGKTCGNYDSDHCFEWSSFQTCDNKCFSCGDGTCDSQCGENYSNCSKDCDSPDLPSPTVDIKANNSDGPITISYNNSATVSWSSENADRCCASGDWSGTKSTSGTYPTGNLTSSKTYTIRCYNDEESVSDSVTVNIDEQEEDNNNPPVANAGPDKETYETESVVLEGSGTDQDNDILTYSWSCTGGTLSNSNISHPTFYAPSVTSDTTYKCTLNVSDGESSDSDSANILVKVHESPSIFLALTVDPAYGCAPLNNVDLRAEISGTAQGSATYFFDCTNDGSWDKIYTTSSNYYTASNLCDYPSSGTYTAKARVERESLSVDVTVQISTYSCGQSPSVDIKANGSDSSITIPENDSATISWNSENADYCYASGAWSGTKSTSGTYSTGNLTNAETYTITCSKDGESSSDSVTVYVSYSNPTLSIEKFVKNVDENTSWRTSVDASPSDDLSFKIEIKNTSNETIYGVYLREDLPSKILYEGNLRIDGYSSSKDIESDIYFGTLSAGRSKTIIFDARVEDRDEFGYGTINLTNRATARADNINDISDSVTIRIEMPSISEDTYITVSKLARNITKGSNTWSNTITAEPGDLVQFQIEVINNGNNNAENLILTDTLPSRMTYLGNLQVSGVTKTGNIASGINIGYVSPGYKKTTIFNAIVNAQNNFVYGNTMISNLVTISGDNINTISDNATINVQKKQVAGAATEVNTGIFDPLHFTLIISFFLALLLFLLNRFADSKNILWKEKRNQLKSYIFPGLR